MIDWAAKEWGWAFAAGSFAAGRVECGNEPAEGVMEVRGRVLHRFWCDFKPLIRRDLAISRLE